MNSVLEIPETRKLVVPISRAVYHDAGAAGLIDREVELLQGIIVKKMSKSPYHILLVRRLLKFLQAALHEEIGDGRCFVAKEDPLGINESEPEPDLAVISGHPEDYGAELPATALLVIEVAVSSLERDRLKAQIYASAGVDEYWIVDAEHERIERYSEVDATNQAYLNTTPFEFHGENRVTSLVIPTFRVRLQGLFDNIAG